MMKDLTNTTSSQVIKENVTVTAHTGNVMWPEWYITSWSSSRKQDTQVSPWEAFWTNPNWGQIAQPESSKPSRSWETREVWETVPAKGSLRRQPLCVLQYPRRGHRTDKGTSGRMEESWIKFGLPLIVSISVGSPTAINSVVERTGVGGNTELSVLALPKFCQSKAMLKQKLY